MHEGRPNQNRKEITRMKKRGRTGDDEWKSVLEACPEENPINSAPARASGIAELGIRCLEATSPWMSPRGCELGLWRCTRRGAPRPEACKQALQQWLRPFHWRNRRLYVELLAVGHTANDGWYDDVGRSPTRRLIRMVDHVLRLRRERS